MMKYLKIFVSVCACISMVQFSLSRTHLRERRSSKQFYVVTDDADTNIDLCQESECHTLAFYMNHSSGHPSMYFNSYETYIFWIGAHIPHANSTVVINGASNLSFIGLSFEQNDSIAAVIDCDGKSVGFVFKETSNIMIKNLMFKLCVRSYSTQMNHEKGLLNHRHALATLAFQKGFNLFLFKVTLQGSVDEAIYVHDIQGFIHFKEVKIVNATSKVRRSMNVIFNKECNNKSLQIIIEDSMFVGNSMPERKKSDSSFLPLAAGLSITLKCLNVNVKIENVTLKNNKGADGGNIALIFHNTSSTLNNTVTLRNSVLELGRSDAGAGMFVEFVEGSQSEETLCLHSRNRSEHQLLFVENTVFRNNSAVHTGGAVYLVQKQSMASCSVGLISFVNCTFEKNSVVTKGFGGTAFHSINYALAGYRHHGRPQFNIQLVRCSFTGNYADTQNIPQSGNGVIFTKSDSFFRLFNVNITNNNSSGILAIGSNVILSGNISIAHNKGSSGGGILLCEKAILYFDPDTTVTIEHNNARHTGGGISVETQCLQSRPMCFFQLNDTIGHNNTDGLKSIQVFVQNNSALFAGDNLFGGSVDHCFLLDDPQHRYQPNKSVDIFKSIFKIPENDIVSSSVTSEPQRVCLCENGKAICNNNNISHQLQNLEEFPGKQFTLQAVLIGQLQGIVPGTVQARLIGKKKSSALLNHKERVQKLSSNSLCGILSYTVYTNDSIVQLHLGAQHSGDVSGYEQLNNYKELHLTVSMKACPPGFTLVSKKDKVSCDCVPMLTKRKITCDIDKQVILRKPSVWIGYDNDTGETLYHGHCPLNYCVDISKKIPLTSADIMLFKNYSSSQSKQCALNRMGVLCGMCSQGHSVMMGSHECKKCSNYWLFLLIFATISGFLLVLTLTALNITITNGNLSGILFFCNIVNSNITIFFPPHNHIYLVTTVLKFFVSSLSSTLSGIPLCLYNGMDAYAAAWLSFAYPFYLWLISGLFICLGDRFNWLVRHNSVKVLATLIILSYSHLLHSVIEALQATHMVNDKDNIGEYLWLKDGNIKYFHGKHIPLVIFSSLLGLILLPFTFSLLCIQCLLKVSHCQLFSWVNRLKPFFDAYTGPFTPQARFWTGLLLLSRLIVFSSSAVNFSNSQYENLGIISLMSFILLFISLLLKSELYKRRCLSIMEQALLLNLGILSTFAMSVHNKISIKLLTNFCVAISFFTFVGIIMHHTKLIKLMRRPLKCIWLYFVKKYSKSGRFGYTSEEDDENYTGLGSHFPPLVQFDQAREPLLD